jgi:hypothetical protein
VLTAVQNPDGLTSTSTGKGPAVALGKLRDRAAGEYRKRLGGGAARGAGAVQADVKGADVKGADVKGADVKGADVEGDKPDVHHPVT